MSKLREQILAEILHDGRLPGEIADDIEKVALQWIEKAFEAGWISYSSSNADPKEAWLRENNLIAEETKQEGIIGGNGLVSPH